MAPVADEGYQPFPDISAWTAVPFDPTTYEQYAALLEQARAEASEEAREHAVKTAMRYAGTDTGAIEGLYTTDRGFTRTVAIEAAGWEAAANERGPNAAEIIKDQIAAYEWVLDLVTQERPVTEHVIRELHAMLCRSQETYVVHTPAGTQERPLPKGAYKEFPNNPTSLATGQLHHYAPPDMVGPEMARLVAAMGSAEYAAAHPVVQAAFVHYSLAAIHPFADGNGRVSRALASIPLYRALRIPLVVFRDDRDEYLDMLGQADAGELAGFVRFVKARVADTAALVVETTRLGSGADRHRSLDALHRAAEAHGAVRAADLDSGAIRLLDEIRTRLAAQLADIDLPDNVVIHQQTGFDADLLFRRLLAEHRPASGDEVQMLRTTVGPFEVSRLGVAPLVATRSDVPAFLVAATTDIAPLELALRDIVPTVRTAASIRLDAWLGRVLDEVLASAAARAESSG